MRRRSFFQDLAHACEALALALAAPASVTPASILRTRPLASSSSLYPAFQTVVIPMPCPASFCRTRLMTTSTVLIFEVPLPSLIAACKSSRPTKPCSSSVTSTRASDGVKPNSRQQVATSGGARTMCGGVVNDNVTACPWAKAFVSSATASFNINFNC